MQKYKHCCIFVAYYSKYLFLFLDNLKITNTSLSCHYLNYANAKSFKVFVTICSLNSYVYLNFTTKVTNKCYYKEN